MIMVRNSDDTYSQVGFIKDKNGVDTEYIYDKNGNMIFEKGFTREIIGEVPLQINGIGKDFKEWSITGNTVQNGTPTSENPVDVQGVGDYDSETGMYKISVVTRGKNLFDKDNANYVPKLAVTITFFNEGLENARMYYVKCLPNTTYTFKKELGSFNRVITCEDVPTVGGAITNKNVDTSSNICTITTGSNDNYIAFYPLLSKEVDSIGYDSVIERVQIVYGSVSTEYEPYRVPITTPIYLDKPLQIGETLNSDGTRDVKWDKVVLSGDENWNKHETLTNWYSFSNNSLTYDVDNIVSFCSHFVLSYDPANLNNDEYSLKPHSLVHNNAKRIVICTTNGDDSLDGFKAWLKSQYDTGTPVTVYYQLETPTTKTIEVPNIPTFNGTTIIDTDTEVKPSNFYGKYKSSV